MLSEYFLLLEALSSRGVRYWSRAFDDLHAVFVGDIRFRRDFWVEGSRMLEQDFLELLVLLFS